MTRTSLRTKKPNSLFLRSEALSPPAPQPRTKKVTRKPKKHEVASNSTMKLSQKASKKMDKDFKDSFSALLAPIEENPSTDLC